VKMESALAGYHGREPLSEGLSRLDLRNAVGADKKTFESAFSSLIESGRAGTRFGLVHAAGFEVALGDEEAKRLDELEARFRDGGVKPPSPAEALEGIDPRLGPALYRLLLQRGRLVEIVKDALPFHADVLEEVRDRIVDEIRTRGELVASEFRDRLGTTRKYIIPLLEHFDKIGLTVRVENSRFLREHQRGTRDDAQG
jgi:selenocysteine-specific elongation factor